MKRFYLNENELRSAGLTEPTIQFLRQLAKIDFQPETTTDVATHKMPITIDGVKYFLLLAEA